MRDLIRRATTATARAARTRRQVGPHLSSNLCPLSAGARCNYSLARVVLIMGLIPMQQPIKSSNVREKYPYFNAVLGRPCTLCMASPRLTHQSLAHLMRAFGKFAAIKGDQMAMGMGIKLMTIGLNYSLNKILTGEGDGLVNTYLVKK